MQYMFIPEAAVRWRISTDVLRKKCEENKICGAVRFGYRWLIPVNAQQPLDTEYHRNIS